MIDFRETMINTNFEEYLWISNQENKKETGAQKLKQEQLHEEK